MIIIFPIDKLRLEIKTLPFPTRMLHNPNSRNELDGESRKRDPRANRQQPWWFDIKNVSISTDDMLNESNIDADRNVGGAEEHQHPKNENLNSALPLELIGHSVPCSSNPYNDPGYGGVWVSSEAQSLVHSHYAATLPPRMALPLQRAEEPVYVNAKQYHGILRRRQSRAKAELEKKVIKVRRPYLHESRHLHAMKRERGCGGRFLSKNIAERSNREMRTDEYDSSKASQSRNLYYVHDDDDDEPKGFSTRVMNPSKGLV